ncbi:MAG: nucleotide sugar dehydrogenase [Litorimonas sp.]
MTSVTLIGLGYVGLPTAALLARAGHQVHGVDINDALITSLNNGQCNLSEADVNSLVVSALETGNLTVSTQIQPADIFVICVPTPITPDKTADLSMVKAATHALAPYVKAGNLIILESTSPVGTTERVIGKVLQEHNFDIHNDIDICYCPERVFPGNTIKEIEDNDRIIGGLTECAAQKGKAFYASFCRGEAVLTHAATAEFSKLMENTYRDVNIALANSFAHMAESESFDIDINDVIDLANMHPRVNVHRPGAGVGGHCIPVDPWFLIETYGEKASLLQSARLINDHQPLQLLNQAKRAGLKSGSKVAILGAAYRADIDDARDSPTETLINKLAQDGYSWRTHDPHVTQFHLHGPNTVDPNLTQDLNLTLKDVDAVFIMTGHKAYKTRLKDMDTLTRKGAILVDGVSLFSPSDLTLWSGPSITVGRSGGYS